MPYMMRSIVQRSGFEMLMMNDDDDTDSQSIKQTKDSV